MEFSNKKELNTYLKRLVYLGFGSQGDAYRDKDSVIKVYNGLSGKRTKDEVLRFSDIKTKSFYFPYDVLEIRGSVVGEVTKFAYGKELYKTDPLKVKYQGLIDGLDQVDKDIRIISEAGVRVFDQCYNTLYVNGKYSFIDTTEYGKGLPSKERVSELERINHKTINFEILQFVTNGFLEHYVFNNKELYKMYVSNDIDMREFLIKLRECLQRDIGHEMTCLGECKELFNYEVNRTPYVRELM